MQLVKELHELDQILQGTEPSVLIVFAEGIKEYVKGKNVFIKDNQAFVPVRSIERGEIKAVPFHQCYHKEVIDLEHVQ